MTPWVPMQKPIDQKHIGKLLEELGEATAAASRCFIQGLAALEPDTGKPNQIWLEDELADLLANVQLCVEHFGLDSQRIAARVDRKKAGLREWHQMPAEPELSTTGEPYRGSPSDDADRAMKKLRQALDAWQPQALREKIADDIRDFAETAELLKPENAENFGRGTAIGMLYDLATKIEESHDDADDRGSAAG